MMMIDVFVNIAWHWICTVFLKNNVQFLRNKQLFKEVKNFESKFESKVRLEKQQKLKVSLKILGLKF